MNRLPEFLVICSMPFLYGAATRLPFIYFVIHLSDHFLLGWWNIGLYVAAYQGSRVVTSALAIFRPKMSHFLGTSTGLAGYIIVLVCDKDLVAPFVIGTAIVGFSETISSMQVYAKNMYKTDPDIKKARLMLKYQYASMMAGVTFAFLFGGVIYQHYGIGGVAIFGIIVEGLGLISLVAYHVFYNEEDNLDQDDRSNFTGDESAPDNEEIKDEESGVKKLNLIDEDQELDVVEQVDKEGVDVNKTEEDSAVVTKTNTANHKSSTMDFFTFLNSTTEKYNTANLPATWVNWLLCVSFGIEALTIGYNLSIGPIFILHEFEKGTGIIGVLFAVGAASGTAAATSVSCTTAGNNLMKSIAASPFDLCFAMGGIAVGVLVAAIPNFVAHVIGLILLMCFNDLGATLLTELQGAITTTSNYSRLGPLGQVVRRCLNVITALTGPILFDVYPRLPYIVAGTITLLWTILLFVLFNMRVENSIEVVKQRSGRNVLDVSFRTLENVRAMLPKHGSTK